MAELSHKRAGHDSDGRLEEPSLLWKARGPREKSVPDPAGSRRGGTVKRLAIREYGPLIAWMLAWGIVGATVGHKDAIRLLAAIAFVRCARYLTGPTSGPSLRKRMEARGKVHGPSQRTALLVELSALAAGVAVLGLIIWLLLIADQQKTATFCLILATTMPVKLIVPLAAGQKIERLYQPLVSVMGLIMTVIAWLVEPSLMGFAIAFAAREWAALGVALLISKPRKAGSEEVEALHWREIADQSLLASRRRFTYRVSKSLLKFVLGPFGIIAARTGRGLRADRKLERFVPRRRSTMTILFILPISIAVALILWVPKPALLVVAATLMRIGASAGNILLWSTLGRGEYEFVGEDEDDDD
ncbi:MAG: hypothetical protein ACJ8EY_03010 [Sphingomicrobium sp.]